LVGRVKPEIDAIQGIPHIRGVGDEPVLPLKVTGHSVTFAQPCYVNGLSFVLESVFVGSYGKVTG